MSQVVELNDWDSLAGYRLLWNKLLGQTPGATFFHSYDWLEAYWRFYGAGRQLRVLVVSSAGMPIGLLPLLEQTESTRLGPVRVLTYPLHDWGSFYGAIGPNPTATLLAGLGHVRRTPADWDLIDLRWVDDQLDAGRTARALAVRGLPAAAGIWAQSGEIECDRFDWAAYLDRGTPKWRENLRSAERRLARRGPVEFLRWRPAGTAWGDGNPRWDLYETCAQLARRSWQGDSATGTTLSHAGVRDFLREAHAAAARAGAAEINLLSVAGQPVAFAYNYQFAGRVFGLRMGYDPAWSREGAGSVLMARMVRDSIERGDRAIDLGTEYLHVKRHWYTRLVPSFHYTHYRGGALRAQALRLKRWLRGVEHRRTDVPIETGGESAA